MAVPHPADGRVSYSQEKDYRVAVATRVIKAALDELPQWGTLLTRIAAELRLSLDDPKERATVQDAFLTAELDLEWTNSLVYETDHFRRPAGLRTTCGRPGRAVARRSGRRACPWLAKPGRQASRTIHECFLELGGKYRHCDVYWAMHKYLKGNRLRVVRANWMLQDDVEAILADPTLTAFERAEVERELEKELVDAYVGWLARPIQRERRYDNGRQADLYDRQRKLIIEAKANHRDDVTVAHGMGQAMYYRSIDPNGLDAQIAVLLRGAPSEDVARLLRIYDVGLIYRDDDGFRRAARLTSAHWSTSWPSL